MPRWALCGLLLALLLSVAAWPPHAPPMTAAFPPREELPAVNIPPACRLRNWAPHGTGSCVHASTAMLLLWQERPELAEVWRRSYHSGETFQGLGLKLDRHDVPWVGTSDPRDVEFLEWCIRTRRGAAVTVQQSRHCVLLVHLDESRAAILDNNAPYRIRWMTREEFLRDWRSGPACWAVSPCFSPPPRFPFFSSMDTSSS